MALTPAARVCSPGSGKPDTAPAWCHSARPHGRVRAARIVQHSARVPASIASNSPLGGQLQIPDDPNPRKQPQDGVVHIDLPPAETVSGRGGMVVVIVMPAVT